MKKLHDIITLENILQTYDNLNVNHRRCLYHCGQCVEELLNDIIVQLNRLLESKTKLSCRNVLVANYKTMTNTHHWLKSQLFADLPKESSRKLQRKVEEMVNLMNALVMKIVQVDGKHAESFLKRIASSYQKKQVSHYYLWKIQQTNITLEMLEEYQAELTADMLIMGVLSFDRAPSVDEMAGVNMGLLRKKLTHGKPLPAQFEEECAKIRRYSHWEGPCFMIDYDLIVNYLYMAFGKLTKEQHIALFEYDTQMKEIHEDIRVMNCSKGKTASTLTSAKAMTYWIRLMELGFVDQDNQLAEETSRQQAMYIAEPFAAKLGLKNKWKPFEDYWGIKNLAQEKWSFQQNGLMPPRYQEIDMVFED